ncbi:unnamed protein product [Dracunculus medinensis]|uniref:ANK_REP_REGION domain-containing protein n=1 Tax=Dracunculus medinensis TaxID=318479 RepID=A0A0N4UKA3_DRAME|nr:unnamed protein product [Dracunculus medinensis]
MDKLILDIHQHTPLHRAATLGLVEFMEILLAANADINSKTPLGWTPLHFAAFRGHYKCVRLLLSKNADVNCRTNANETPLHLAVSNPNVSKKSCCTIQLLLIQPKLCDIFYYSSSSSIIYKDPQDFQRILQILRRKIIFIIPFWNFYQYILQLNMHK